MSNSHFSGQEIAKKHTLTKHIITKLSFKFTLWNRRVYIRQMFTLNMKPVFPVGIFEMMIELK